MTILQRLRWRLTYWARCQLPFTANDWYSVAIARRRAAGCPARIIDDAVGATREDCERAERILLDLGDEIHRVRD